MYRLSRYVIAHRPRVVSLLVALCLAGGASLALLLPSVSERNEYPALSSYQANEKIRQIAGNGGYERPILPVLTLPVGVDDPGTLQAVRAAFAAAAAATGGRALSYADAADPALRSADGRVTVGLLFGPPVEQGGLPGSALGEGAGLETAAADAMRRHLPPGATVAVTGLDALATGSDQGGLNVPIKLAVTVAAALAALAWVFRSRLAAVPLLVALVAIPVSFLGLLLLSPLVTIHETTVIMLPLLGVGIAVDYALIVVSRWREERGRAVDGEPAECAVHRAMATSGRAVGFSAVAVAIGLATMVVLPIPLLRSLGIGGMLVTAAGAAVSLTLLPLVLARHGRRLDSAAGVGRSRRREEATSRAWTAWARLVVRHRYLAAVLSAGVLLGLCAVAPGLNLNVPVTGNLADSGTGRDALDTLQAAGIPGGLLSGFDVAVPGGADPQQVADRLAAVPGVAAAAAPGGPAWSGPDGSVVTVLPVEEAGTEAGRATIDAVRAAAPDGVLVGGNATQQSDYVSATYAMFPVLLALVALVTLVVLTRAFRSLLLAVKAIVLNLLSLGAVLGAMVLVWQWGWGTEALLGIVPDGAIGTFVPVTIFVFLFGLTMDYEVFILSRMREVYDETGSTTEAIVLGLGRTGRQVSCAALILFFSFASMAGGGELDVAIFASGVALGILIDATLVRAVLVPATVAIMGRWNWWLPDRLARVLRVVPRPAPTAAVR